MGIAMAIAMGIPICVPKVEPTIPKGLYFASLCMVVFDVANTLHSAGMRFGQQSKAAQNTEKHGNAQQSYNG